MVVVRVEMSRGVLVPVSLLTAKVVPAVKSLGPSSNRTHTPYQVSSVDIRFDSEEKKN